MPLASLAPQLSCSASCLAMVLHNARKSGLSDVFLEHGVNQGKTSRFDSQQKRTDRHITSHAAGLAGQQAAALYKIKEAVDGDNHLSDWQSGASNACSFSGVTCNANQEAISL